MDLFLPSVVSIVGCVVFGIVAIVLSIKEEKLKKTLHHLEEEKKTQTITQPQKPQQDMSFVCSLLDKLNDGVCILDNKNNILCINEKFKEYFGFKGPVSFKDLQYVLSQWYPLDGKLQELSSGKTEISDPNTPFASKTYALYLRTIELEKEKGVLLTVHDTTDIRHTEENRDDLTNMMVHELRSPLTAIKDSAELMVSSSSKLKPEQTQNLLALIVEQSRKLLDEVGSILDAAKLENGKLTMNTNISDLAKVVKDRVSLFSSQANSKHITLTDFVDPAIPLFVFDSVRIGQVVNNLLSNSLKFTPAGGTITLTAKLLGDKKQVEIEVKDSGVGIPLEKQKDLFSKFGESETSQSAGQKQVGTGLGLYVVKGIVTAHNGTISVSSKPNEGTTITFSLPLNLTPTITKPSSKI